MTRASSDEQASGSPFADAPASGAPFAYAPAPVVAPELYGRSALRRIARALPPFERAYAEVRFAILRSKLLTVMDLLLPESGRILDIGCGFGLFAAYFGQTQPARDILGVDPDEARIEMARDVARTLDLPHLSFRVGDARTADFRGPFDGAYVLDVMHHIPRAEQTSLLERLRDVLAPGGVLLLKDITTEPFRMLAFTALLDRAMVGPSEPLAYRHHRDWAELLVKLGFSVRLARVPDVLPYPHVVIAARKS
jgi:SAM-dependent methyltransferase